MPQDLPGFYFDPEKKRYFPIKGPIRGCTRLSSSSSTCSSSPNQSKRLDQKNDNDNKHMSKRVKALTLLQNRELSGKALAFNKLGNSFQQEYKQLQTSQPVVLSFQGGLCNADSALEQFQVLIQTPKGEMRTSVLALGSMIGTFRLFEVVNEPDLDWDLCYSSKLVWPLTSDNIVERCMLRDIATMMTHFPCSISSIKRIGKHSSLLSNDASLIRHALVTTLGSGDCGGSVYVQDFSESLNFTGGASLFLRTRRIASLDCTIWTADCHNNGTHAVVGTNIGAALVNLETGGTSWVYHSKSDIFSQQFVQSGNVVLCGHRNGAIVPVDIRQRQSSYLENETRNARQTMRHSFRRNHAHRSNGRIMTNRHVEMNADPSSSFRMSSSVCSLVSLQSDDRYFIGSSMDGYINLYDLRLQKGAVQSYRGHMNSHTHLQLGVDPSETFVMSGGEDFGVRIWNIKTGKLLFGEFLTSVPTTVCWPLSFSSGMPGQLERRTYLENCSFDLNHNWGGWLGSEEGLFYMQWM